MMLLLAVLCSALISASAQSEKTCEDLEQLIQNTNADLLTKCAADEGCTLVMCQADGSFANFFGSLTLTLEPCGMKPGVKINLLQKDGTTAFSESVTAPTVIARDFNTASVTINVFVDGAEKSVNISINPVVVDSGELGIMSDFLINSTSVSIDQSNCKDENSTTENESEEATEEGLPVDVTTVGPTSATPTTLRESAPNMDTCVGLEELAMNINPSYLGDCSRDDICTQVTCETAGGLGLDEVSFSLDICNGQTGIAIELTKDGSSVFNQLVTSSTTVTSTVGNITLEADIFVITTSTSIGISVDPVTISDQSPVNGTVFVTDMLVNFTVVPFNTTFCNFAIVEPEIQNSGMTIMPLFELFLLTLAVLFINGAKN